MGEDAVSDGTVREDGPTLVRTTLASIDPRSAAKLGAAVGVCLFVAWMIAAVLVYIILGAAGVWDRVNSLAGDLLGADGVSAGMYFGIAALVGVVEVVVAALFIPLGAMLYNAVAGYVGGLRVTLGAGAVLEAAEAAEAAASESVAEAEVAAGDAAGNAEVDTGTEAAADTEMAVEADTVTAEVAVEAPAAGGAAAAGWGSGTHRVE
jgi:hypothetical protein